MNERHNDFSLALHYHECAKSRLNASQAYNPKIEYKVYPNAEAIKLERIDLAHSKYCGDNFLHVLYARKSTRVFSENGINLNTLSRLLTLSFGLKDNHEGSMFRTYASAGARYPIEVYVVVTNSVDFKKGMYHYNVYENTLELLKTGDYTQVVRELYKNQGLSTDFPCLILFSLVFARTMKKYGERGYRYALLDAGHMGQNLYLVATYLNLGLVAFGQAGATDDELDDLLLLGHSAEDVIYSFAVGHP